MVGALFQTSTSIEDLPPEVIEKIMAFLNDIDIASAAHVNSIWREISQRCLRQKCEEVIPEDILTEILSEQECSLGADWATVWSAWIASCPQLTTHTDESSVCEVLPEKLDKSRDYSCWTTHGSRMFMGSRSGRLESIHLERLGDYNNINTGFSSTNIRDGGVYSLQVAPYFDLLIAAGQHNLHFYDLSSDNRLEELPADFSLRLGERKQVSVFGPRFCARNADGTLEVLEIYYVGQAVRTQKIGAIFPEGEFHGWQLWREKLICTVSTGEILVFNLLFSLTQPIYRSEAYTVIMYKNPTWIFRDVVLASTLASRGLDSSCPHTYVYMSDVWNLRDSTAHWFIGPVDHVSDVAFLQDSIGINMNETITASTSTQTFDILMRGFCLKKLFPGSQMNVDVTCISLRRRLVLCGSECGMILLYSPSHNSLAHSNIGLENSSTPIFTERVSEDMILRVDIGFSDGQIYLCYETSQEIGSRKLDSIIADMGKEIF